MSDAICPAGHRSDAADFCSVCGAEIAPPAAPAAGAACPDCGTPAGPGQVFCEVCGHNFRTGGRGVPPAPTAPVPAAPSVEASRWELTVEVDGGLYGVANPDAPIGHPAQTFTLFDDETLLGRGGPGVRVQVPVPGDPGVSRRQVLLALRPGGGLVARDVGSANGTQLNGRELVAGVEVEVADGDVIAVGAWTRITARRTPR